MIRLLVTMEEFSQGPTSLTEAKRLRQEGGWCFKSMLVTDSMSLYQVGNDNDHQIAIRGIRCPTFVLASRTSENRSLVA